MAETIWNKRKIIRMDIKVSGDTPIYGHLNQHNSLDDSTFDMHYPVEMGIVLQGKMCRHYRDWSLNIVPGEVWLTGIWEPHGYQILEIPCKVLVLLIWPQLLANSFFPETGLFDWLAPFKASPPARPQIPAEQRQYALNLAERTASGLLQENRYQKLKFHLSLMELLVVLVENWESQIQERLIPKESYKKISHAVETVLASKSFLPVEEVACQCGLSRNIFSKLFKNVMGISFAKFSMSYRLREAANQLICSTASLKEIADEWGFSDKSHLTHRFKEHFGCSPNEYRQQIHEK